MDISDIYIKPWFQFEPFNYKTHKNTRNPKSQLYKDETEVLCHFIVQDCNMGGVYWIVSTWYNNDPNRYFEVLYKIEWNFSKTLIEMKENDMVHLNTNPNIKFKVSLCKGVMQKNQINFCKILERVL